METYTDPYGNVIPKGWGVATVPYIHRVTTFGRNGLGQQAHRGYQGLVKHKSLGPSGERCPHFHQKSKSARACAAKAARKMAREAEKQEA
jgi:hypothetical protein